MDQNQDRRRGHFHRGRRGPDRRGFERRTPPPPEQHTGRDHVDVEQIMRDIRARIAQRHGVELSTQQIQELAARRLEAILDPRAIKPALLDQLRRAAGAPSEPQAATAAIEPPYSFDEDVIYGSHRGGLRFVRRLLKPLLMLFFNPAPVTRALSVQARLNVEAAQREVERDRRQAEWNALHYEILQRLVTEVSRASIELQSLSLRIESLAGKVDFNERRVRHIEGTVHQTRPAARPTESTIAPAAAVTEGAVPAEPGTDAGQPGEASRRRRRRRRGRRGGSMPAEAAPSATDTVANIRQVLLAEPEASPETSEEETAIDSIAPPAPAEGETRVEAQEHVETAAVEQAPSIWAETQPAPHWPSPPEPQQSRPEPYEPRPEPLQPPSEPEERPQPATPPDSTPEE